MQLHVGWIVALIGGIAVGRYVLPQSAAEASPATITSRRADDGVREIAPPALQLPCANPIARPEAPPPHEPAPPDRGDPDRPEDPDRVDADGLTADERWESEIAEMEDALPRDRGAIHGQVRDETTGEPLVGVTVVASAPELVGSQAVITDEHGRYVIRDLPPGGRYLTTFYYLDITVERSDVVVAARAATPLHQTLTQPPPTRTFESVLGAAAPQGDSIGISFSGTTSIDNVYIVEPTCECDCSATDQRGIH